MLRRTLLALSRSTTLRRLVSDVSITRNVAHRFVAGEHLEEALRVTADLNARGMSVTLDYLGESVADGALARQAADVYLGAFPLIAERGLDCSVSVKPTQVGLDVSLELCRELLAEICVAAAAVGTHVTIDMEGSDHTVVTVELVTWLRSQGHDNVGCAVQAYLRRTSADVAVLSEAGASLRLCKGAYAEDEAIAWQERPEVSASYVRVADQLLQTGHFPRFATHDDRIIDAIRNLARRHGVPDDAYEFQMLYGIREPLQQQIVAQGHGMRIYVPFGDQWYPYLTRRLAERPANLVFFLRALTGKRA